MNAQQSKMLLEASRQALVLLDPEWTVAIALKQAIAQVSQVATKAKHGKIPKVAYGPNVWRDGRCLDTDDARTFANMVHKHFDPNWNPAHIYNSKGELTPITDLQTDSHDPHADEREAQRERLSHCACSHLAVEHYEDKDGNLLKCNECECEQFRYEIEQAA